MTDYAMLKAETEARNSFGLFLIVIQMNTTAGLTHVLHALLNFL